MARPREIDERKHPEQSRRVKRAMEWAGIDSAAQLHERITWGWSPRTTTTRVEGDTRLSELERQALANLLNVPPEYLEDGGPELPNPRPAEWREGYLVTGADGAEQVTIIKGGHVHAVMSLADARAQGVVAEEAPDDSHLPSDSSQPSTSQSSAEPGPRAAES